MKTMLKVSGLLFVLVLSGRITHAQDCEAYFPMNEGAYMEMKNYDDKDKLTSTSKFTVVRKDVTPTRITIVANVDMYDEKEKKSINNEMEMYCENGVFYIDMQKFLDEEMMKSFEGAEVSIQSENMEIPANLQVGQTLNDASITMGMATQGISIMNMKVYITNRKVEAYEDVTTPAGTFGCYKISYNVETKMMMKVTTSAVEWMAKDIGTVRSESYNSKGKLQGYSILTDLKR